MKMLIEKRYRNVNLITLIIYNISISITILNAVVLKNEASLRKEKAWSLIPSPWDCPHRQGFVSVKAIGEKQSLSSYCLKLMTTPPIPSPPL